MVLLLIYLGGMLVVLAFSCACAGGLSFDEPFEASPHDAAAFVIIGFIVGMMYLVPECVRRLGGVFSDVKEYPVSSSDIEGLPLVFSLGGAIIVLCAHALFLTLLVVIEVVRGPSRGALRAP